MSSSPTDRAGVSARTRRSSAVAAGVLGTAFAVMAVGGCSGGEGDNRATDTTTDASAVAEAYEAGEPLQVLSDVAADLENAATPTGADTCQQAVARLDGAGTPDQLAAVAAGLGDPTVAEAALEQQAAVSSLLAACRGDAPVSVEEAAAELAASNESLDAALDAAGVKR